MGSIYLMPVWILYEKNMGTYWLAAGFPNGSNQLGNQNGASTKHGETIAEIKYPNPNPVLKEINVDSNQGRSTQFTIDKTTSVTLKTYVTRGLNQWSEIARYPNSTYSVIGKNSSIIKTSYVNPWDSSSITKIVTEILYLEPGTYWVAAAFPNGDSQLGNQNGASTKHGATYATLEYIK